VMRDREELQRYAAEIAVVNRKLQQAAYTDALTGLPNRRSAVERLQAEWTASAGGQALACMMVDIDHFKKVNDTYGHDVGDLVLQETARVLAGATRKDSSIYRLGGEEFLVMCPGADSSAAAVAGERLCQRVRQHVVSAPAFQKPITVSVGVAAREGSMRNWGDLLKAADQAVYLAKQGGLPSDEFAQHL